MNNAKLQPSPQIMAAMAKVRAGDNIGALGLIDAALADGVDPAPLHALAGLAAQRMGDHARAVPHLEKLLEMNPADVATRANLANAHIAMGDNRAALEIAGKGDDPRLTRIQAYVLQGDGKLKEAATAYRLCIANDDSDLAAWNNLGNVLTQLGETEEAIHAFERAIPLAPADLPIYLNLADLLRSADRPEARVKVLQDALAIAPEDETVLVELGTAYARLDDYDLAIQTLSKAIELAPGFTRAHIELGMIYESLNQVDNLSTLVDKIDLNSAPPEVAFLQAWKARREGRFEEANDFAKQIPESVHSMRRFHLVGGIADRLGNTDEAFAAFARMNKEAAAESPSRSGSTYREDVEADLASWTDEWANDWPQAQVEDGYRDPIFLVGFPRSGTTLLDTMLMGLSDVSVLEERPMMARTVRELGDEGLPDLTADRIGELRAFYFDEARKFGWDDGKWLVDKHPLNMERVPAIHRLFPNAKIILAERHPYDVVFSCFMANFQLNRAMRSFTDLEEAARTYDAVWQAWHRSIDLFDIDYRTVRYERLVEDTRGELEPLVEWLGLEWSDRLLDHTTTAKNRGRVRTASYSQIGEQLYTRASYRWRRYAKHLRSVMPILRPWAQQMGYETE